MIIHLRHSIGKEMKNFVKLMRSSGVASQNLNFSRAFMLSLHFSLDLLRCSYAYTQNTLDQQWASGRMTIAFESASSIEMYICLLGPTCGLTRLGTQVQRWSQQIMWTETNLFESRNLEDKVNTGSGQSKGKNGIRSPHLKSQKQSLETEATFR